MFKYGSATFCTGSCDKSAFSDDPTFDKCLLKNYFNASLDVIEFKPILLNELLATKYL
jgi:hypothetical protein